MVTVSVLFNEPKLLKSAAGSGLICCVYCFSALQRAEIAEMLESWARERDRFRFSALQRAEIAEILYIVLRACALTRFSALQRAEIAEIAMRIDVLLRYVGFSALQRAEIAEIYVTYIEFEGCFMFQCSSTSRNC